MKKYIIFDIDRTIVDSYEPELLSFKEAIFNVTGKKLSGEDINNFTSLPTVEFFKLMNVNKEEIRQIYKEWDKLFLNYKTTCFDGIKEVIKYLHSKGFVIGIITSRTMYEFNELYDVLEDIIGLFKIIITSDMVNSPKPSKDSIDYLCDKLNCESKDIIYIGDSKIDKLFSINSNIDFIPACWENKDLSNEKNACFYTRDLINIINSMGE